MTKRPQRMIQSNLKLKSGKLNAVPKKGVEFAAENDKKLYLWQQQ